ncbi:MAG: hypothetical protein KAX20_07990, partial [Candidatus Omnitrophica bacterium]|nr:hypothetical protein [Candidatus Omnitrophota bacterium]
MKDNFVDMAKSFWRFVSYQWPVHLSIADFECLDGNVVEFSNGSSVYFRGVESEGEKGRASDLVIFDEADFFGGDPVNPNLLSEIVQTLPTIKYRGSFIMGSTLSPVISEQGEAYSVFEGMTKEEWHQVRIPLTELTDIPRIAKIVEGCKKMYSKMAYNTEVRACLQ